MPTKYYRKDPHGYVEAPADYAPDPRADRTLIISAPGCGELLEGTGYRHGQLIETDLDGALHIVKKLHEHGLDVMFGRMSCPFVLLREAKDFATAPSIRGVRCIWVVPVNWNELA